ncbi:MAG: histidinol dehydrogenase [Peptostreptococcaceae bacterium]|nr:histidinol dehydrogenase [Peptostreptococcaceae bacterium]
MKYLKRGKERSEGDRKSLTLKVEMLINDVRDNGDKALLEYNEKFDQCTRKDLRVSKAEIEEAYAEVDPELIECMKMAKANIEKFANVQSESIKEIKEFEVQPGIKLGHRILPIEACCCYVPGGSYPLYSTALMLAIPAKVAGVKRIVACSPPIKGTNKIHPLTLVAMDLGGVDEIYVLGGTQAIAAFSYGTESIKPVDIIVGPGNQYVTEAKRQCYGQVGIDFIAGPSEVLIIADESSNSAILAADILGQSEHDFLAKGILLTTSKNVGENTIKQVEEQLKTLETREIAGKSWEDYGEVILCDSIEETVEISNKYAPEHLELAVENPDKIIEKLTNYGSLFIGENTAEVFGDYASGTNHTLPTLRAARYTGGVYVGTFLKTCTHQSMTREASKKIAPIVSKMAEGEGLIAHARAAKARY